LAIVLGSVLDGIPESFVLGLTVLQGGVSLSLLAGVALSNLPEGMSSSAGLKQPAGRDWVGGRAGVGTGCERLRSGSCEGSSEVPVQDPPLRLGASKDVNWRAPCTAVGLHVEATLPTGQRPLHLAMIPAECASSSSGVEDHRKEGYHDVTERQAHGGQPV
jgi:hypothetical protein